MDERMEPAPGEVAVATTPCSSNVRVWPAIGAARPAGVYPFLLSSDREALRVRSAAHSCPCSSFTISKRGEVVTGAPEVDLSARSECTCYVPSSLVPSSRSSRPGRARVSTRPPLRGFASLRESASVQSCRVRVRLCAQLSPSIPLDSERRGVVVIVVVYLASSSNTRSSATTSLMWR